MKKTIDNLKSINQLSSIKKTSAMRKSFTRLSSVLVLLFLSVQLVMAAPTLVKNGISPADGKVIDDITNTVFTLTFKAPVQAGEGQIIALYNDNTAQPESKAIQLKAGQKTVDAETGAVTYTHPDGTVVFESNIVSITFNGVNWKVGPTYWITIGPSAIWDVTGNFNVAGAFDEGTKTDRWDFTIKDVMPPKVTSLTPKDDADDVPSDIISGIHFDELVRFTGGDYTQMLEDIAVYTQIFAENVVPQEGGDLVSLMMPNIEVFNGAASTGSTNFGTTVIPETAVFDSISITWQTGDATYDELVLPPHTALYVRVQPGLVEDLTGNDFPGINNETSWNFTTKDDDFAKPTISYDVASAKLNSKSFFTIDFADDELLYLASSGAKITNGQDLKDLVSVKNDAGDVLAIKTAKIEATTQGPLDLSPSIKSNTIKVVLNDAMVEKEGPFTVCIKAGVIKDKSGNLNAGVCETFAAGNWDAPELVNAYVSNQSGTSFDFYLETNEPAYVHYIVVRKDPALVPGTNEVFGFDKNGSSYKDDGTKKDMYYRIKENTVTNQANSTFNPGEIGDDVKIEGNDSTFYGKQTDTSKRTLVEIFAEGDIFVPQANFEVLERVVDLPSTHGFNDDPTAEYEIYYILIDTMDTQGDYPGDEWLTDPAAEHLSSVLVLKEDVYTVDILMPEAWFDGDTILDDEYTPFINDINKYKPTEVPGSGELETLARDGRLYINFNEAIRKNNGQEFSTNAVTLDAELQACLYVYEGAMPGTDATSPLDSDAGWSTNYGYTASLSADKKQIIIEPDSSWASEASIWVKIRNSKIEDSSGNEIVPYGDLYAQEYVVEDYIPALVRYTYENLDTPMDGLEDIPYQKYVEGEFVTTTIDVTVSDHIFVPAGTPVGDSIISKGELLEFTSNPTDDQYIGKFFKIRKGDPGSDVVSESDGSALEDDEFSFTIDYDYGDSTKITITPNEAFDSEVWYFIEMDENIIDRNLMTIGEGAAVDNDADRHKKFKLNDAWTGNATDVITPWVAGSAATDDNKTMVFKSDDSRNPVMMFFSKKLSALTGSSLLDSLVDIDGKTGIVVDDTIGVYIDEYVSLGFDHFVHFDNLSGEYSLDANAMRRYFKVFDNDSVEMDFDILDIYTIGLDPAVDSMVFYIDPYYVDENGLPLPKTETKNFNTDSKYTVYFNSKDLDDNGIDERNGKEKGIYWDDNNNLVMVTWAQFETLETVSDCVTAIVSPVPGSKDLNPNDITEITIEFEHTFLVGSPLPYITVSEGSSSVYTSQGAQVLGQAGLIRFPVTFASDSTYTIEIGCSFGGEVELASLPQMSWPTDDCNERKSPLAGSQCDSTWTYTMIDGTRPALDTMDVSGAFAVYGDYLVPMDDEVDFDKTDDIVMVFNEKVTLVSGKTLTIYDSAENETVRTVYAQNCHYGYYMDGSTKKEDQHVIVIPASNLTKLQYNKDYHIVVDEGFVVDQSPAANKYIGIDVEDVTADGAPEDLINDWSFATGSDPAPYYVKFTPADGVSGLSDLQIEFSEPVYDNPANADQITIYEVTAGPTYTYVDRFDPTSSKISASGNNKVWTIDISPSVLDGADIEIGKHYAIDIPATAFIDGAGNILATDCDYTQVTTYYGDGQTDPDSDPAVWSVIYDDIVDPFIQANWPRDGYEHIPYNAYIYIEFNEPIALSDGSAIIPDPNLLTQNIDGFLTVSNGLTNIDFDVEFVGNDKQMIRITPFDPNGYGYNPSLSQPTMQAYTNYTVTLNDSYSGYELWDAADNAFSGPYSFMFLTEDITAPVISNPTVAVDGCSNKFDFTFDAVEASDTLNVYWAVLPADEDAPSAADLFAVMDDVVVPNAIKQGSVAGNAGTPGVDFTVDMGDWDENPRFILYAVTEDLEEDVWAPATTDWDSLFMFGGSYGEGYDRIRDILDAPNRNSDVIQTDEFMIWDNDAPHIVMEDTYPKTGEDQIPVDAVIKFKMSEDIGLHMGLEPDSITLRRYDNNIAVQTDIYYDPSDSIIYITPLVDLKQETKYYVEIDRYAIEDTSDVCTLNTVFHPQWVGRDFWFETEDNIGPRFVKANPEDGDICVSCPDLNAEGDAIIQLTFYDANELKIYSKAPDKFIYFYRADESVLSAWAVVKAEDCTFEQGSNDTTWVMNVPLTHQYYPNENIRVVVPQGLVSDIYDNVYTNDVLAYIEGSVYDQVDFSYKTCNTEAPAVTWAIHALDGYFSYSEESTVEDGINAKWIDGAVDGDYGDVVTGVSTHAALKVDFGEEVEFHTNGDGSKDSDWESINDYTDGTTGLTNEELMSILSVSGLNWNKTSSKSDVVVLDVTGNVVTLGFQYAKDSKKLPTYDLLAAAEDQGNIDGGVYPFLDDWYFGSLVSETSYSVTVTEGEVRATTNCLKGSQPRYVESDIVTFTTRNDEPPTVDIVNENGESLCDESVCIKNNEVLTISFSDPVVKSSFDVLWLGEESYSYDNLPLSDADLTHTGYDLSLPGNMGRYIEFFEVTPVFSGSKLKSYNRGDQVKVNVVALDDNMMNYQIQTKNKMISEGWYEIQVNEYALKKFEDNGPNGTVIEEFTCHFFVGDNVAIKRTASLPQGNGIVSDTKTLDIVVDETPALGTGTLKLRREDGSIFAEFDASEGIIYSKNPAVYERGRPGGDGKDTISFVIGKPLEEFTKYYIEAPEGFIVDNNDLCDANPMKAIGAKLDPSTGELLSADWWFMTTDATPPQLISVNNEGVELAPNALFPEVGGTVSKNSVLIMRFDENIEIIPSDYAGIVIYHDNGENPEENFGNAVEFIPWSKTQPGVGVFHQISISGSDVYNNRNTDIVTIDPELEFIANGTYYVRISGMVPGYEIQDVTGNSWDESVVNALNPIRDTEWWFTVTNDVEPVLVATTPDYDGVNSPGVYEEVPSLEIGYVLTDLTLTFEDSNGNPLDVARGDELRMLRIFEYTYDAASADYISKPWLSMPITHDSIDFDGNVVTVKNVKLRDGIRSVLPSTGLATDSCYYVTVDAGAVLNGYDLSQTWWPGISHGFRWRFTTGPDTVFVPGYDIVSPNIADDGDLGKDLTIEVASELIVEFNEGVEALADPTGLVKVYDANGDSLVEAIEVTPDMCEGATLTVPCSNLYDEATFYVVVEAGAFGDTSTVSTPNWEFGGADVWSFHTGDNTPPVPVLVMPHADCVGASPVLELTYDETINDDRTGVVKNVGTVVITDTAGVVLASLTEADIVVDGNSVSIDLMAAGVVLPDTSLITVTLLEGLVLDGDVHSPLASPEYSWSFTTGENTLPFATLSPAFIITPDTTLTLTFNEVVNAATLKGIVVVNGDTITLVSTDSIVYTGELTNLMSETVYDVVIPEGAFMDENAGCTPNGNAETTLNFEVDDIAAPVAEYYPSTAPDYRDLELVIVFDEEVTATTGYVVIYTEAGEFADSIEVGEFATTDNITYTYTTNELFFGSYYVMIDAGTFVDNSAAPVGVEYAGISTDDVWTIDIVDPIFENCLVIVSPLDGTEGVAIDTELEMTFNCEIIKPGNAAIRYVTVAKQDNSGQEFIKVEIVESMISEDGHTLIVPVSGLEEMTTYSVTVAPGAIEDEAGNQFEGIIDANTWNFTTGDFTAPTVTLVADTVNNLDGTAVITSNEAGTVYLVHSDVAANVDAITAAIADGKAVTAPVVAPDVAITVSTVGLVEGLYYAVATDVAGNVGQSVDKVLVVDIPTVTIAEIQGTGAASPLVDKIVMTSGVVTGKDDNGFFIQDANAKRSGIWVYDPDIAAKVGIGTGIKIAGTVDEYFGLTEITDVIAYEFVGAVVNVQAKVITADEVGEDYEGVLVQIEYLHATALPDANGEWMTQSEHDGGIEVKIDEQLFAFTPELPQSYMITGVVNYSWDEYKLAPRMLGDITALVASPEFALGSTIEVYPNPFDEYISFDVPSELVLTKAVITNIAGQIVKEVSNPEQSIETTQLSDGVYFIALHTAEGIAKTQRIIKR